MNSIFKESVINERGAPEVTPKQLLENQSKVQVVDVRRDEEFTGELGHIQGAQLVTLGPDLEQFLKQASKTETYVFVCRSGARSSEATMLANSFGIQSAFNMEGGMLKWNALDFPTEK